MLKNDPVILTNSSDKDSSCDESAFDKHVDDAKRFNSPRPVNPHVIALSRSKLAKRRLKTRFDELVNSLPYESLQSLEESVKKRLHY